MTTKMSVKTKAISMKVSADIGDGTGTHLVLILPVKFIYSCVDRKDCTPAFLCSKTTQTTGGEDRTWEGPPHL